MSDGFSQSGDVVARVLDVSKEDLKSLANAGVVVRTGQDKYNLIGSVQKYIKHIKMSDKAPPTQVEVANHLDMSERNARDVLKMLGIDWTASSLADIRTAYIRDLRDKAAGRGGDQQSELTKARTDESVVKAALGRLQYHEKLGALVPLEDVERPLMDWAGYTAQQVTVGFDDLKSQIETKYQIEIDTEMVNRVVGSTTTRIQGYAKHISQDIVGSVDGVLAEDQGADSEVVRE